MILTDVRAELRDAARSFARERLAPGAAVRDAEHRFPAAELREMGALGFLGMLVPEEYGGSDTGMLAYAAVLEEIAAADGACSTIMSVHSSVGCVPIVKFGTEQQKRQFLPQLASGEWIGGFALTEPQAGSDAAALRTRARRDGDTCVLSGAKQFITSGKNGQAIITFAVTDPDAGKKGISAFIVPTDTPGYEVVRVEQKLGQHSSDTCQIAFNEMRLPASLRLGEEGQGYRIALSNLEGGRIGIAAQSVGMARAAFAAGLAAALLVAVPLLPGPEDGAAPGLRQEVVSGHVRSLLAAGHLTDVPSSDRHTVKPWFAGRLDFAPPTPDLADAGFPLAGGRLDYLGGRAVAALVYRRRDHVINVFVWPDATAGTPAAPRQTDAATAARDGGHAVLHWAQSGLAFWTVSDLNAAELADFARLFRARAQDPAPPS